MWDEEVRKRRICEDEVWAVWVWQRGERRGTEGKEVTERGRWGNEGKEEAVGPLDSLTEREVCIVGDIENGFGSNVEGGREKDEDVTIL